jgi:CRP/FNR family transcriptional regulator
METAQIQKSSASERQETQFCHGLSPSTLEAIDKIKKQIAYPKGALIFAEGQHSPGMLILTEGRVKLTMSSSQGNRFILRVVEPGGVLGLNATVCGGPHQVSAETLEPCKANYVRREDLLRLMREDGGFRLRVLETLCYHYNNASAEIGFLGRSPAARLARFLLESLPDEGDESPEGWQLYLGLTHEEIAEKIGVARETVSRIFAELQKRRIVGAVNATRSHLVILDRAALCEISSGDLVVRRKR